MASSGALSTSQGWMPTVAQMFGKFSASSTARVLDSIFVPMEMISVTPASAAREMISARSGSKSG